MTVQMNIAEAKAKLSELVTAAEQGQEVIIARGGQPAVRIVPIAHRPFQLGLLDGKGGTLPDFLEPMTEAELRDWE